MGKRLNKVMSLVLACTIGASMSACANNGGSSDSIKEPASQEQKQKYTVTVTGGTGGGTYEEGTEVTIKADAAESGRKFVGWYDGTEKVSSDAEYKFTVGANVTLMAKYADDDLSVNLNYVDKFDAAKNNYWDGGEWADCKGKLQSAVTNGSGEAYVFSMRTTDESGKSLVPASYEKPSWFDGISDIWVTSVVEFDGAKDLTKGTVEFDVKFDNMAKGVMIFGQSGENKTFSGLVCTDKKNFNGNTDSWDSFVNITELENGWYHYEFDFANYATIEDNAEHDKANVLEECEILGFIFYNGAESRVNELCKGIDYTKEGKVYVDNLYVYEEEIVRYTLTVKGGEGGGRYKKDSDVTVKAIVPEGSAFLGWYNGNEKVSEDLEYTVKVTADITLVAKYGDGDYTTNLSWLNKFDAEKNNYWDGGEWADCKGELQSDVTCGSNYAYKFSMKTADKDGNSLVPVSYEKPSWFDGISEIWATNMIVLDEAIDLSNSIIRLDVKFDNMAKGVMLFGQTGDKQTFSGLVCTDTKNFNGNADDWNNLVTVTELENGWYRYEFDFAKYAVLNDSTGDKANVLEECEMLGLTFLNGSKNYNSNLCKGIDFTKESVVYVDNMVILDKDEIDLAGNLTAVHGKTEMVDGGNGSKKTFKYTGSTEKNWEEISLAIDETDMTGKKVVFDVKFENISQGFDVKIGAVHTTYCFTDGNNLNGGADSDLAAYKVTNLGNGWFRYEVDASKLLESSGTGDITSVTSITLLLAVGNVDGWKNELNKVDAAKANVLYIDNFKIV